jgi:hypothetical protein
VVLARKLMAMSDAILNGESSKEEGRVVSAIMSYHSLFANGIAPEPAGEARGAEAAGVVPAGKQPSPHPAPPFPHDEDTIGHQLKMVAGRYFLVFDWVDGCLVPPKGWGEAGMSLEHAGHLLGDVGLLSDVGGSISMKEVEELVLSAVQAPEGGAEGGREEEALNHSRSVRRRRERVFRRFLSLLCERCQQAAEASAAAPSALCFAEVMEVADRAAVLMHMMERMQAHRRLQLARVKLHRTKNFILKDFRQAQHVLSIFSAFLHHCSLHCPSLAELEAEADVDLHVLECFQAAITTVADTLFDPRWQARAPEIIAAHSNKAEFLMTMRPAIRSASAEHAEQSFNAHGAPLSLQAPCALIKADSERTATMLRALKTPPERKIGRFLSDSDLSNAQGQHRSRRDDMQSLGLLLLQRKRRMVAGVVARFLADERFSLAQARDVAATVERNKAAIKGNLEICRELCRGFSGAMVERFRAICLGTLCGSWHFLLDVGVCEEDMGDFLLGSAAAIFKEAAESGGIASGRATSADSKAGRSELSLRVGITAAVLLRNTSSIARIFETDVWESLMRCCARQVVAFP